MRSKSGLQSLAEERVRQIRRQTRKRNSTHEKFRIMLEGLRGGVFDCRTLSVRGGRTHWLAAVDMRVQTCQGWLIDYQTGVLKAMSQFYAAIWRVTWRHQIAIILLSILVAAIAAVPLRLQQEIINKMVSGADKALLLWLAVGYFGVVALSALLKVSNSYLAQRLGEQTVCRMRKRLYEDAVLRDTPQQFDAQRGTLVNVISSEAEGVGTFVGSAISGPVMQIGTMISVIGFILASEPGLGLIALFVILPQLIIVVAVQGRINARLRERTRHLRDAADRISASEMKQGEKEVIQNFEDIFNTRIQIFKLKLSSKFAQNLIAGLGNSGILLLGGLLVIDGKTDAGIVVASLSGLARVNQPWRELVQTYRMASSMQVNFDMIVQQFPELGRERPRS